MANQRDDLLDAATCVLGGPAVCALTQRAVDARGLARPGSTPQLLPPRDALRKAVEAGAEEVVGVGGDGGVVFGAEGPKWPMG